MGDKKTGSVYQGQIKDGYAWGIGRSASAQYGIYEGMWNKGVPSGYGSMVDQHTDHYEGMVSFKTASTGGTILCDGEGTYTVGGDPIEGTFGMGVLNIAADKAKQGEKIICSFQQGYADIDYKVLSQSERDFNTKI